MKWALVLLALAGCAPHVPPELLTPCAAATMPPAAPKPPRTAGALIAWTIELQLAREATTRALVDCSRKHDGLAERVGR